jgi:hypothetical protein
MNHETDFDDTARMLTEALGADPPPEVEARMRERLDALRTKIESPPSPPAPRRLTRRRWLAGAAALTGVCAAALFAIVLLPIGASRALAQIADAVAEKTWLHASGAGPDGKPAEMWFSAKNGILAYRAGDSFVFVDHRQGTMDIFGKPAPSDAVQRMPLAYVDSQGIGATRQSFLALLAGNLQEAVTSADQQVLEHESKTVRVAGREVIEHRFVVGRKGEDESGVETLLEVNPKTGLPTTWRTKNGDQSLFDFNVSYPERGPLTIVALGVPENAPIVDLAPEVEFARLLVAGAAARRRFDDYHAIVVESHQSDRANAWDQVYRIWRSGNRWRVDQCRPNFKVREEVPEGVDPKVWWLEQAPLMKSYPREIWDGKRLWTFEPEYAQPRRQDPADPRFVLIESLKATSRDPMDRDDPESLNYRLDMPEFYGYENLSLGASFGYRAETRAEKLDDVRTNVVDIIRTFNVSPNTISPRRYWLDPQRGNMMVRKELFRVANPNQATGASEVVTSARTPTGLSYPTMVRLIGNTVSLEDGSRSDSYVRYYLEFDTPIPDELFHAESVSVKDFWTQSK